MTTVCDSNVPGTCVVLKTGAPIPLNNTYSVKLYIDTGSTPWVAKYETDKGPEVSGIIFKTTATPGEIEFVNITHNTELSLMITDCNLCEGARVSRVNGNVFAFGRAGRDNTASGEVGWTFNTQMSAKSPPPLDLKVRVKGLA